MGLTNDSNAIASHDPPRVSVIIPTYLRPETLLKCAESILAGSRRPQEIVIVGRSGDRGTEEAIAAIEASPHPAVCVRSAWVTEPGHVPPVEMGVRTASADLVAIVDDDVTVTAQWLSSLLPHFADRTVGAVGGPVLVPGEPCPRAKGRPGHVSWYGKNWGNLGSIGGDAAIEVDSVMEGNGIWRRELLASLEFDPVLNFDDASMYGLDLCLQAKQSGYRLLYEPSALVYHHVAPRASGLDRQERGSRLFSYCRNYTYIGLKRFPLWRRLTFLVWWFLVGERDAWGAGSLVVDTLQRGWRKKRYVAQAYRGKMEGLRLAVKRGAIRSSRSPARGKPRVLFVCSHPVQYASPSFRQLAKDPKLEIEIAYCNMQGAEAHVDLDFGVEVKWDVPLLEGYPWTRVPNRSPVPNASSFFGLFNPGIWRLISKGKFDAVVLFTGYMCATFWIALAAAKWNRIAVLFGTDAHELAPRDHKRWKLWVKERVWPRLFALADVVLAPSSGTVALVRSLGVPKDRVVLTPYCVDNEWWTVHSRKADRRALRARWNVPEDAVVVLFCAKLQPWKRPHDLLRAFAQVADPNARLVFAGDGPLRNSLESEAFRLGIAERVRFLGFVNQSGLPETYCASDVLVLPSEYEPFGVVVNEAMLCGCPVIVSDRVGARFDLVREAETGFVFRFGDVESLATVLGRAIRDRPRLQKMGEASQRRMMDWSPAVNEAAMVEAITRAIEIRREAGK